MPTLTSCIFEDKNFGNNTECRHLHLQEGGWGWNAWVFENFHSTIAYYRPERLTAESLFSGIRPLEIAVYLPGKINNTQNQERIDASLPENATRISEIRAGLIPYSSTPYFKHNPGFHQPSARLMNISFRIHIDLGGLVPGIFCYAPGGDTRATISYFVYIFRTPQENLRANVEGWRARLTESAGLCNDKVLDALKEFVPTNMDMLESTINQELQEFDGVNVKGVDLIPGKAHIDGEESVENAHNEASLIVVVNPTTD